MQICSWYRRLKVNRCSFQDKFCQGFKYFKYLVQALYDEELDDPSSESESEGASQMFGGQSGFNFEVPPESFIAEEDIVPDDDEDDPDYCEPMIVSVQLSDREQLKVCPRASATPRMPVGIEDRSMGDRSLEPMIVAIELGNRNIRSQSQDSKTANANTTSSEDARVRRETQLLAEPVSVIKATALEANVHSVKVSESQPPPPAAEVQAVATRRKSAESATKQEASAPISEIGGDAPVSTDVSNETPETVEVSNDAMETADVSNEIPKAAEVGSEAPETAKVSNETPEITDVHDDIQKVAEVSSDVPVTANVSSGDESKSADVGINGGREVERMEQRMDNVSLEEPEQQQQEEPTVTQTIQQQGDTGDIQETQMHEESEAPPTTTAPTTEDMTVEPQSTTCTEVATPLINAGASADENQKFEQESTPPVQEQQLEETASGVEGVSQMEGTEGEKMEEDTPQGGESVAPTAEDESASAVEEAPEDKASMEVEEKPGNEIEREDISKQLLPQEDVNQTEGEFTVESSSDKIEVEERVTTARQAEEESVPQLPSDEIGPEDATVSQTESESERNDEVRPEEQAAVISQAENESVPGPIGEAKPEEPTATVTQAQSESEPSDEVRPEQASAVSEAESESVPGPSDEVKPEEPMATVILAQSESEPSDEVRLEQASFSQAGNESVPDEVKPEEPMATVTHTQSESEPSDEIVSEEQTTVVIEGEINTDTSVSESREVEQEEREEPSAAVEAEPEKLSLSAQADTMSVDGQETEVDQTEESTTIDQQEHGDKKEEEEREIADSAVARGMGESEQINESKSTLTPEELPPPTAPSISQAEDDREPSEHETQTEKDHNGDKMEIEATQESESKAPPFPTEIKSSPSPPVSEASSNIPAIVVSMEESSITSTGDEAVGDSDSVVEPASSQAREHDTPFVEKQQEEEETISHPAEADLHIPAAEQPQVDTAEESAQGLEQKEAETNDESEIPEQETRTEMSCMELSESTFEIEQASVIVEPPSSVRDELESELMLSEDFDDDMDIVDSEPDQEEVATAVDEAAPVVSSEPVQEEGGGEVGIDDSSPVISSELSCEEETAAESSEPSQEETAVPDELVPVISSHSVEEEERKVGIDESAPVISSEPSCEDEMAVESSEPSKEERETADEVAPVISSEIVQERVANDDGAPALSSEPVQEGDDEGKIANEDAPVILSGSADESEGAAVDEHEEGVAPVISSEPVDEEQGAADVESTGEQAEENIAESASQPKPPSTQPSLETSDKLVEQDKEPDKLVEQDEETSGGEREERQSSLEVTADLDKLAKPDEETSLTSGDVEKEQQQPLVETTPNPDELAKPDEESNVTAKQGKEDEQQEQLMDLPPDPDEQAKLDLETGQTTSDVGSGEQKAAVGGGGEEQEGEGEVSRESGGLQLESGPIEVDVLLHAEEDDLSVFSAEAAEADKALTLSSSSSSSRRKKPQSSSSLTSASTSSRQRRSSKSSSALVSPSLGEAAKASSTGPGASSAGSSTASGSSVRRVSISSSSGPEATSSGGGGGEKRPRSEKSEVRK